MTGPNRFPHSGGTAQDSHLTSLDAQLTAASRPPIYVGGDSIASSGRSDGEAARAGRGRK